MVEVKEGGMIASKLVHRTICLLSVLFFLTPIFHISLAEELECQKEVAVFAPDSSEYQQIIEDDEIDLSYLYREGDLQACEGATLVEGEIVPNAECSSTIGVIFLPIPYLCTYVGLNGMILWCTFPTCHTVTLWIHLGNCLGWCIGFF